MVDHTSQWSTHAFIGQIHHPDDTKIVTQHFLRSKDNQLITNLLHFYYKNSFKKIGIRKAILVFQVLD